MNVNDDSVLEMINNLIASDRLNKKQILQIVNLASISNNIKELKVSPLKKGGGNKKTHCVLKKKINLPTIW